MDFEKGGLSPGGIGYDINCGVRMLRTSLTREDILKNVHGVLDKIYEAVPCGVGSKSDVRLVSEKLDEVLNVGARWAVENGYGNKHDLEHCEENGSMKGADSEKVSGNAKGRGKNQLDTLGAGNHFLEVQYVDKIFNKKIAKKFGIENEGQVTIMIHCLPGDAKILTEYGCTLKINELEKKSKNFNVKCMNINKHNLEDTGIVKFFRLAPHSGMFKINTKSGKKLVATGDHPVLTPNGLRLMEEIREGEKVAVLPYEGVEYEEPKDDILVGEDDIRKVGGSERVIKRLRKKNLLPLRLNSKCLPILTKLLGFLTGDGWLGKNKNRIVLKYIGTPEDLEKIKNDILKLGYKASGPYKLYSKSEVTYTDGEKRIIDGSSYQIVIHSLGLPMLFYALGAPFGNKSKTEFKVPDWIFKSPLWIKRLYLAGFFGAELNKPSNPKKEVYRFGNPLLSINKLKKLRLNGYEFLNGIVKLLKDFDIEVIKILEQKGVITKKGDKTIKLRLKISSKKGNLLKLWSKVGYEYCQNRAVLSAYASQYINFEQYTLKKEAILANKPESKLFITSHKFRINNIIPFPDFVGSFRLNPPTPIMWDTIESKEKIENYKGYVYDFTVSHKDHNFIADGFVTGNCGSRGLGHQVCTDYLRDMYRAYPDIVKNLPDRELVYAPSGSKLCNDYFAAMAASANYAWCNRHIIADQVRGVFEKMFKAKVETIYDVAHNIAKIEEHMIDGKKTKVYLHRKGATRAFPPGHKDIPEIYRDVGQPIIIPGSMGTASYLLVGVESGKETFYSTAHGSGRLMSRFQAKKQFRGETIKKELEKIKIYVKCGSWLGICEEAPGAYKDIDEVVKVSHEAGIGNLVARVKPICVIKG